MAKKTVRQPTARQLESYRQALAAKIQTYVGSIGLS